MEEEKKTTVTASPERHRKPPLPPVTQELPDPVHTSRKYGSGGDGSSNSCSNGSSDSGGDDTSGRSSDSKVVCSNSSRDCNSDGNSNT